jgi:hypothetical protein
MLDLCGIDMISGLFYVLPMLKFINPLMKFVWHRTILVCDYITMVKICQTNL